MSYLECKKACRDNTVNILGSVPANNPLTWNVSVAILQLADAVESDFLRLSQQVEQLRREIARR